MRFIVAITGGIGSGKSTVTDFFSSQKICISDADIAARTVVNPGQPALKDIIQRYGSKILLKNGFLDRKQLRNIIFENPVEKNWLEELLHPKISALLVQQLTTASSPYAILSLPLLTNPNKYPFVNRVLVVDTSEDIQIARTMTRDGISKQHVLRIMAAQFSREQRLKIANDIVDNSSTLIELKHKLEKLHQHYLLLAQKKINGQI